MEKQCKQCLNTFPLQNFYRHPQTSDGYFGSCKSCVCKGVKERTRANPTVQGRGNKAWRERNIHKVRAARWVYRGVRDGRLKRSPCEVCGETKVQGHHDDYSMPLQVRWLCDTHHKAHHNRLRELRRAA